MGVEKKKERKRGAFTTPVKQEKLWERKIQILETGMI